MWKCKNCSEENENNFASCWNCGYMRNGTPPKEDQVSEGEAFLPNGQLPSQAAAENLRSRANGIAEALSLRYKDAYFAARWRIRFGNIIKWGALVLAIPILIVSSTISSRALGELSFLLAILSTLLIAGPVFVIGILVSGQGQYQLATIDTAVNTSRHLSKDDVADIILG